MKMKEIITEEADLAIPEVLYHGTDSKNLTGIFRYGLKPKVNRYASMYRAGTPLSPEQKKEQYGLSTTDEFSMAKSFAEQGGSMGSGNYIDDDSIVKPVVLSFKPLPTDKIVAGIYMGDHEFRIRNVIHPDRLEIVWPKNLTAKQSEKMSKAEQVNKHREIKLKKIKELNAQLKKAGSILKIKSGSPATLRVKIYKDNQTQLSVNLDTPEFSKWFNDQLVNPTTLQSEEIKDIQYRLERLTGLWNNGTNANKYMSSEEHQVIPSKIKLLQQKLNKLQKSNA